MKKLTLLGGLSPAQFLNDYWHKKPLLIRQAIPDFQPLLSREALFRLAARDDVELRLISRVKQHWKMQEGPFDALPSIDRNTWTLLVQGVNLHNTAADELIQQFRF